MRQLEIRNLDQTRLNIIVDCLSDAFHDYFVEMPSNVEFWGKRFKAARVDYSLSFGAFDEDKLVAFIIQGIDMHNHQKTAFNTGTGVIKAYRGQMLVDKLYNHAFPILQQNGIDICMLEVIDKNHRAIAVYERIGFKKDRFLKCFNGTVHDFARDLKMEEIDIMTINPTITQYQKYYTWDHTQDTILKGGEIFKAFFVKSQSNRDIGYFVINTQNKSITQLESFDAQNWATMIQATKYVLPEFKLNNVDRDRHDLINALEKIGLTNHINQFEMTLTL